jgi:glycosyltransferase involved in cell wall biosynthesis
MKIIIIGPAHPYRGGLATFNECIAQQYQKEGVEVKIETFTLQYPSFLFPGKTQYTTDAPPAGVEIARTVHSVNPFNWIKVGRRLRKEKADLVLLRYWMPFMAPCMGTIGRLIRKNKKTKVVGLVDNIIPHEKRIGDNWLSSYFVNSMDAFVVLSDAVKDELRQFDKEKPCLVTPHPTYDHYGALLSKAEAAKQLGLDASVNYLLFFGFIRDYKGLDILMRAYADKRMASRNVQLIVAGEFYNNADKYHRLEEELGLKGKIHWFSDYIPNQEVTRFFSIADLVVQPYKTATQSGISQMAYHFEKPMVVTAVGGLPEIVPHGKVGYVVPVDDKAVADAIVDFYDHHTAADFIPYIKEEKKKYTWENFCALVNQHFL